MSDDNLNKQDIHNADLSDLISISTADTAYEFMFAKRFEMLNKNIPIVNKRIQTDSKNHKP